MGSAMSVISRKLVALVAAVPVLISSLLIPVSVAASGPTAAPGAPTIGNIVNVNGSLVISMVVSPGSGGDPESYEVTAHEVDGSGTEVQTCQNLTSPFTCTVTFDVGSLTGDLTLGARYTFSAIAINSFDDNNSNTSDDGKSPESSHTGIFRMAEACSQSDLAAVGWTQVIGYMQQAAEEICELWITDTGTQTVTIPGLTGVDDQTDILEVLLVGAGGGGSAYNNGSVGGGAGGAALFRLTDYFTQSAKSYSIEIGAGGAGGTASAGDEVGEKGSDSKFGVFVSTGGQGGEGKSSASAAMSGFVTDSNGNQGGFQIANASVCLRESSSMPNPTFALEPPFANVIGGEGCAELRSSNVEGTGSAGVLTFADLTVTNAGQTFREAGSSPTAISDLPFAFAAGGAAGTDGAAGFLGGSGSGGDGGSGLAPSDVNGQDALASSGSGGGGGARYTDPNSGQPIFGDGGAGADGFAILRIMFSPEPPPQPTVTAPVVGNTLVLDCSLGQQPDVFAFNGFSVELDTSGSNCSDFFLSPVATPGFGFGNPSDPNTEWHSEPSQGLVKVFLMHGTETASATSPVSKTFTFEDFASADSPPPSSTVTVWWTPPLDPPSGLAGVPNDGKADLSWTPPGTANAGAGVQDFDVVATPTDGSLNVVNQTCSASPCEITGLTLDEEYGFEVKTVDVGNRESSLTQSGLTLFAIAPPGVPTVSATAGDGDATITVTAGSGGAPASYTVTGGAGCTITAPSTSCTISGLQNGTSYTFTATATNNSGTSTAGTSSSVTPAAAPPGIPTLSNEVVGDGQITVDVTAGLGGTPTKYTIIATPSGGGQAVQQDCNYSSSTTSCVVTGLSNGVSYDLTATASDGNVTTNPSTAISGLTPALAAPGVPTISSVTPGDSQAEVSFSPGTGGTPASYTVTATPVGGGTAITQSCSSSPCTVTSLDNGTNYNFTVSATNSAGSSTDSTASGPHRPQLSAPGVPTITSATAGNGEVTLVIAAGSGGQPATYEVTASPASTLGTVTCQVTSGVNPTTCVVGGLTNGTSYTFTATATNTVQTSASSAQTAQAVTPTAVLTTPGTPTISTVAAGNAKATITVTAPVSGGAADDYEVAVVGDPTKKCTISATASPLSCEIAGLTNGVDYQFEATASNSAGSSTTSAAVAPASAVPLTPTVSASSGNTQATLTLMPGSIGEVTSFDVDVIAGGATVMTVNCPATAGTTPTSCVVTGLTNGTSYTFAAVANNGAGSSVSASNPSNAVSPAAPPPPSSNNTTVIPTVPAAPGINQTPAPAVNTNLLPTGNQNAVASVGGQLQPVTVTPASPGVCQQSTSCQVPSGAISNGTTVSVGSTQLTVSGPALGGSGGSGVTIVMPGQPVNISANGFEPNSQAALFALPLGSALASLTVGSDGLLVAAPELDELLPANTTAIQITGNTANGPIALSVKILVAVAPEPARTSQQLLPQTNPGSVIVLINGGTSQYQPKRFEQKLVLDAEATSLAVSVLADSEPAPLLETGDLSARKNQWLNLTGSGYSEYVDVFLFSEPRFLGRVLVGQDGSFIGSLQIPNNVTAGWHTLQTVGKNADGLEIAASFAIEIRQAEPPRFWTKAVDKEVKLYGLHVVGAGKVQFFQNGKEVAWIRADNDADPKLRVLKSGTLAGRDYFVRTRVPVAGKNVFEIYLNGERVLRRIFTLRG